MTASFTSLVSDYLHQAVSANDSISLTLILTLTLATLFLYLIFFNNNNNSSSSSSTTSQTPLPPTIPHSIPFIGNAIPFGMDPVGWIKTQQLKYGDTFTFTMMGRRMTMCLGEQGNHFVFNVPVKQATAEGAYVKLMRPVFGKEVVYDVDNATFMEQKKFIKDALTTAAFISYMPIIQQETADMMDKEWKSLLSGGEVGDSFSLDVFHTMSELTIRTASACLMGKEIRDELHSNVAKLYNDLDRGLTPLNVFFEHLPLPRYWARDAANAKLTSLFLSIMEKRRQAAATTTSSNKQGGQEEEEKKFDVLEALMKSCYRNGNPLSDVAVAHLMIALLMAGQHTSSTTSTWMLFRLAQNPQLQMDLLREQAQVLTGNPETPIADLPPFDLASLKQCTLLDACLKETLRMHPPIHTVMRLVEHDGLIHDGMSIPRGHFICAGLTVGHYTESRFESPNVFDARRAYGDSKEEWTLAGVDVATKSARNLYLPFGAGRHRCIGEHFAYIQNKTIVAMILREYILQLPLDPAMNDGKTRLFPESDFTQLIVLPKAGSRLEFIARDKSLSAVESCAAVAAAV